MNQAVVGTVVNHKAIKINFDLAALPIGHARNLTIVAKSREIVSLKKCAGIGRLCGILFCSKG